MAAQRKKRTAASDRDTELQQLELAFTRIGMTRTERIRWLLEFAKTDFDRTYEEQRIAPAYELSALRWLGEWEWTPELLSDWFRELKGRPLNFRPITDDLLRQVHSELAQGLKQLFSVDKPVWQLPLPGNLSLKRVTPLRAKRSRIVLQTEYQSQQDEKAGILHALSSIIRNADNLLRACAECHSPFIAVRRQQYCSTKCSQKARDKRRKK